MQQKVMIQNKKAGFKKKTFYGDEMKIALTIYSTCFYLLSVLSILVCSTLINFINRYECFYFQFMLEEKRLSAMTLSQTLGAREQFVGRC